MYGCFKDSKSSPICLLCRTLILEWMLLIFKNTQHSQIVQAVPSTGRKDKSSMSFLYSLSQKSPNRTYQVWEAAVFWFPWEKKWLTGFLVSFFLKQVKSKACSLWNWESHFCHRTFYVLLFIVNLQTHIWAAWTISVRIHTISCLLDSFLASTPDVAGPLSLAFPFFLSS